MFKRFFRAFFTAVVVFLTKLLSRKTITKAFRVFFTAVVVFFKYLFGKYWEVGKYLAKIIASTIIFTFLMLSFVYLTIFFLNLFGLWTPSVTSGAIHLKLVGHWPSFMLYLGQMIPFNYMTTLEAFVFIFVMANFEEVVFRHMIMDSLLMKFFKMGFIPAALISSVVFGMAHFNNAGSSPYYLWLPQVIGAGCAGLWLAYLYKTCGLHLAVFVHVLHNFTMFALARYYYQEMGILQAGLIGIGGMFLYVFLMYKYPKFRYIIAYIPIKIYHKIKGKRELH